MELQVEVYKSWLSTLLVLFSCTIGKIGLFTLNLNWKKDIWLAAYGLWQSMNLGAALCPNFLINSISREMQNRKLFLQKKFLKSEFEKYPSFVNLYVKLIRHAIKPSHMCLMVRVRTRLTLHVRVQIKIFKRIKFIRFYLFEFSNKTKCEKKIYCNF